MKRLSDERDANVREAILAYKRIVTDDAAGNDEDWEMCDFRDLSLGFFLGYGLSKEEALEASEFVISQGW